MLELVLASRVAVVGERLRGELAGLTEPAEVALVRVERCPTGTLPVSISSCAVEPTDPTFELVVPEGVPPACAGVRCELGYVVRARSPVRGRRRAEVVVPVEVRGGDQTVHEGDHLYDRLIASHPARHFHLELAAALLEGGGHLRGRVHVAEGVSEGVVQVAIRCRESWRTNFRIRNWRHPPLWDDEVLWQHQTSVELEPARRWYPFGFDIPPGLPLGMEGYIVSWRYEIEAHRHVRARPDERAVITPLRFEIG
jgi:hypothetical protein